MGIKVPKAKSMNVYTVIELKKSYFLQKRKYCNVGILKEANECSNEFC